MLPLAVLNDLHIGAIRSAGTTPQTAYRLRLDLIEGFGSLLVSCTGCDLIINGDLFDKENVPMSDLYAAWQLLRSWLAANPSCTLILPPGNHDLSKTSTVFTSFDMLVKLLQSEFGARVITGREGFAYGPAVYVIPHVANQDLFNLELAKVTPCDYLFLHCNFDNGFAAEADHSLNLSKEQAEKLPAKHIIIGHEHQMSTHMDGKIILPGNQMPSSVSDCLGNDKKWMLKVFADHFKWLEVCDMAELFLRIDWRALAPPPMDVPFVRVEGEASAAEASDVVSAISAARKGSNALVLTNAVKIEGTKDAAQLQTSLEDIKSFKVMDALMELLTSEEQAVVRGLLETNDI